MKKYIYSTLFIISLVLTSCSSHDYVDAIPGNSIALIAVNAMDFAGEKSPFASLLTPFVDKSNKQLKGIDLTKDIYLFESGDGSLGLCAPVSDGYDLDDFLKRLKNIGSIGEFTEIDGVTYCVVNNSWVIGYDDYMFLVMGPVTGADAEKQMIKRMSRLVNQDSEHAITNSDLWKHMSNINASMKMVARASALPEQMVASVTLGSPKGTNPSDVLVEGSMEYKDSILYLDGGTSSFNPNVDQALKKAASVYKPLTVNWQKMINDSVFAGVFMNVDGEKFMPYIQSNRALNTMLMGSDAYERIQKNKGDMAILVTQKVTEGALLTKKVGDSDYSAHVCNLPKGNTKTNDRLVVCLNLHAITGSAAESISPFIRKIQKIVYRLK